MIACVSVWILAAAAIGMALLGGALMAYATDHYARREREFMAQRAARRMRDQGQR